MEPMKKISAQNKVEMGQGLVEYALILVLIAVFLIVALSLLGGGITNGLYNTILPNI
jgi:Flp pilus assembly pilin Flp